MVGGVFARGCYLVSDDTTLITGTAVFRRWYRLVSELKWEITPSDTTAGFSLNSAMPSDVVVTNHDGNEDEIERVMDDWDSRIYDPNGASSVDADGWYRYETVGRAIRMKWSSSARWSGLSKRSQGRSECRRFS